MTTGAELVQQLTVAYEPLWAARAKVQDLAYRAAVTLALETWPEATFLVLSSSDQSYESGWVLAEVVSADGYTMIEDWESAMPEGMEQALSDLDWTHPRIKTTKHGGTGEINLRPEGVMDDHRAPHHPA